MSSTAAFKQIPITTEEKDGGDEPRSVTEGRKNSVGLMREKGSVLHPGHNRAGESQSQAAVPLRDTEMKNAGAPVCVYFLTPRAATLCRTTR